MEDIVQKVITEVAVNTGNTAAQLKAIGDGFGQVNAAMANARKGSEEYSRAEKIRGQIMQQQKALFAGNIAELKRAAETERALANAVEEATLKYGEQSKASLAASSALTRQRAEVERLRASSRLVGSGIKDEAPEDKGGGNLQKVARVFTELRQSLGGGLRDSALGITGNLGQLAVAVGSIGFAAGGVTAVVGAVFSLGQRAVETAAKFEKMRAVLKTTLGSDGLADQTLQQLLEFSAATPFAVEEITDAYIKFANRGLRPTNEQLTNLGDFAAATGKGLDQLTEAILDVSNQERWNEFGIKVTTNGNKIIGSFKGVTKEFEKSEAGAAKMIAEFGKLPGVAGGMAAQSATLGGLMSNLSDNFDQLYLAIGNRLLPVAKGMVSVLNTLVGALSDLAGAGYGGVLETQGKVIAKNESEIKISGVLFGEYKKLTAQAGKTADQKARLAVVTGQLSAVLGAGILETDKDTKALKVNELAYLAAIRVRRLVADTEIAIILENQIKVKEALEREKALLGMQKAANDQKLEELRRQKIVPGQRGFGEKIAATRDPLLASRKEVAKAEESLVLIKETLADLGLKEVDMAEAMVNFKTNQLTKENEIIDSRKTSLKIELEERRELEERTKLDGAGLKADLITNSNLKAAAESGIKAQEVGLDLAEKRRKIAKELDQTNINIANADARRVELEASLLDLAKQKRSVAGDALVAVAKEQLEKVNGEIAVNKQLAIGREFLLGKLVGKNANGLDQFDGGELARQADLRRDLAIRQRNESLRQYALELVQARRALTGLILDLEQEQAEGLADGASSRAVAEFAIGVRRRKMELEAAIESFNQENRFKGLKAAELDAGRAAIRAKGDEQQANAVLKLEEQLFNIRKSYNEKSQALGRERANTELAQMERQSGIVVGPDAAGGNAAAIAKIQREIRDADTARQIEELESKKRFLLKDKTLIAQTELEIQAIREKARRENEQADFDTIGKIAKARMDASRQEAELVELGRALRGEQSEGRFLEQEAANFGKFFFGREKMERDRSRERRKREIDDLQSRGGESIAALAEQEDLARKQTFILGSATNEQQAIVAKARVDAQKASNAARSAEQEDRAKTRGENADLALTRIEQAKQISDITIEGIQQITAANDARLQREEEIATNRLNRIYQDLEVGRQVNEETIRREQERLDRVQAERQKAAQSERAITLGQIVLQQILAVSAAAASAAKTTQWFTIPIAVAAALLAITAGAQQARASVRGFRKGVIRLDGGRDESARDSVQAELARGESVMTVASTNRAERVLRKIQAENWSDRDFMQVGGKMWQKWFGQGAANGVRSVGGPTVGLSDGFDRVVDAIDRKPVARFSADASGFWTWWTREGSRRQKIMNR